MEESLSITLAGQLWAEVGNSYPGSVACSVLQTQHVHCKDNEGFICKADYSGWHMTGEETEHAQQLPCTVLMEMNLYGNVCFVHFNVVARARNLRVPECAVDNLQYSTCMYYVLPGHTFRCYCV